jgi:hypothetical protein
MEADTLAENWTDSDGGVSMTDTTSYAKSSSSAFASMRSRVVKPSVNVA